MVKPWLIYMVVYIRPREKNLQYLYFKMESTIHQITPISVTSHCFFVCLFLSFFLLFMFVCLFLVVVVFFVSYANVEFRFKFFGKIPWLLKSNSCKNHPLGKDGQSTVIHKMIHCNISLLLDYWAPEIVISRIIDFFMNSWKQISLCGRLYFSTKSRIQSFVSL